MGGVLPVASVTLTPPDGTLDPVTVARTLTRSSWGSYGYLLAGFSAEPRRALAREVLPFTRGEVVGPGRWGAAALTLRGTLVGRDEAEFWTLRAALVAAVNDHGADPLTVTVDHPSLGELVWEAHADAEPVRWSNVAANAGDFLITLVAPDAAAYEAEDDQVAAGPHPTPATAAVAGNVIAYPTIAVSGPLSGTTTGVTITNVTTGRDIELAGLTLVPGETLEIVMAPGYEAITEDGAPRMDKKVPSSRFWGLRPGANLVSYEHAGDEPSAVWVSWRAGWVL